MTRVGVLAPVTGGFYFGDVLAGVVERVAVAGGTVTLVQTLDAGLRSEDSAFAPGRRGILPAGIDHLDGVIAVAWAADEDVLRALRMADVPVVIVAASTDVDAATVLVDNDGPVRAVVDHLVDHGHDRIAFVGNTAVTDMRERWEAYRAAMAAHGLRPKHIDTVDHSEDGGTAAVPAVLQAWRAGVTALVCSTDRIALALLDGLRSQGLQVPTDLAVVGFDDLEGTWSSTPPLATVRQDFAGHGRVAASLLLAELRGEPVEHRRHVVPAPFVPRGSCGCPEGVDAGSDAGERDAQQLVDLITTRLGDDPPALAQMSPAALAELDTAVAAAVAPLRVHQQPPERRRAFTRACVRGLYSRARALDAASRRGADVLEHCLLHVLDSLAQAQALANLDRVGRLSTSLSHQYDVGLGLLADLDADPRDLRWLSRVHVRAGCLGLWDGAPEDGVLRLHGVFDPEGLLDVHRGARTDAASFPPSDLAATADPSRGEVCYVIPVRGPFGDHGLLCVVGGITTEWGGATATYHHWAALLGAALRERDLVAELRRSEERYAGAASAANDGLWEWDARTGQLYVSDRCHRLLATTVVDDLDALVGAVHPEDRAGVRESIAAAFARGGVAAEVECRVPQDDGTDRWLLSRALGICGAGGVPQRVVGSLSDIHHRKALEERLREAALFDPLTGLPNRRLFLDRLAVAIEAQHRDPGTGFAVLFLDLDGFKLVNDSLGHLLGDDLLRTIATRLRAELRGTDTAARFGGDEFAVLLTGPVPEDLLVVAERLQRSIAAPVVLGDQEVSVTASIGIAAGTYTSAEDVLRDADIAMYQAKESDRGTACLFDPRMHARARERLRARSALAAALEGHQFVTHFQPLLDLDGAPVSRFEALVRWQHPEKGLLGPAAFLDDLADGPGIVTLGRQVRDQVCAVIARWRRTYGGPLAVAVNLAHREFWDPDLLPTLRETLGRHGVPPECLVLEITESVVMTDREAAREVMTALRAAGFRLHLDDFGTGHSSLHALRTFPLDALKIDGAFVREIDVPETAALVGAIVTIARALGLEVVAECVETPDQAERLRALGCTTAQGWLYASALPPTEADAFLGTRPADVG